MKTIVSILSVLFLMNCSSEPVKTATKMKKSEEPEYKVQKTETEWRAELSPEQYVVLREAGTERPGTGKYYMNFEDGVYHCAACGETLFLSESKFNSNCGWPSFDKEIAEGTIVEKLDTSFGMVRTEILCGSCGGHLGHVFNDGPTETGLRYCVNSLSLEFTPSAEE